LLEFLCSQLFKHFGVFALNLMVFNGFHLIFAGIGKL
jgi:hypothetical protein